MSTATAAPFRAGILIRFGHWLRNVFALLGLFSFFSILLFFAQGHYWISRFDPYFLPAMQEFTQRLLQDDLPQALVLKRPLEAEVSWESAKKNLVALAKQQEMPVLAHYALAVSDKNSFQAELYEFCDITQSLPILMEKTALSLVFPCRLLLFRESAEATPQILMPNIELFIRSSRPLPADVQRHAMQLHDRLFKLLLATVTGHPPVPIKKL